MAPRPEAAFRRPHEGLMPVRHQSRHANGSLVLAVAALIVTWAMVHGGLVIFRDLPVFEGGLIDPDSYMRMVRVSELAQGWQWFDDTIARANAPRSEEHTSELQSLMRISYAVFCLKKKN